MQEKWRAACSVQGAAYVHSEQRRRAERKEEREIERESKVSEFSAWRSVAKRCQFRPKFYVENPCSKLYNPNGVDLQFTLSKVLSCDIHFVRPRILLREDPSYMMKICYSWAKIYDLDVILIL